MRVLTRSTEIAVALHVELARHFGFWLRRWGLGTRWDIMGVLACICELTGAFQIMSANRFLDRQLRMSIGFGVLFGLITIMVVVHSSALCKRGFL